MTQRRFEARDLKPYIEHCPTSLLRAGEVYFRVTFLDERMVVPELAPLVFVGRNLSAGDIGMLYFQDFESYSNGVRYGVMDGKGEAYFERFFESQSPGVFEYEQALDVLLDCSLRRRELETAQ